MVTPRTPAQPRAQASVDNEKGPTDLFRSTEQYRLDIQANPTVPILDIYAQAPTAAAAARLANAAANGLGDYLGDLGASERTPEELQVKLRQLGPAEGEVLNDGVGVQLALVTFLLVFAASCAAVVLIARVRSGWRIAAIADEA